MNIRDELKHYFASTDKFRARKIECNTVNQGYVYRDDTGYGILIPIEEKMIFNESFSAISISTIELLLNNEQVKCVYLKSFKEDAREEFSKICEDLLQYSLAAHNNDSVHESLKIWYIKWRELIGNNSLKRETYDILGELLVLEYLQKKKVEFAWTAISLGTHDFETKTGCIEVKSSTQKYNTSITISSQNQLKSDKQIDLMFIRFEKSPYGISINDVVKKIEFLGYDMDAIEMYLNIHSLNIGKLDRDEKYNILEKRLYKVDEEFPTIEMTDIVSEHIDRIQKIVYTIDLAGIPFDKW